MIKIQTIRYSGTKLISSGYPVNINVMARTIIIATDGLKGEESDLTRLQEHLSKKDDELFDEYSFFPKNSQLIRRYIDLKIKRIKGFIEEYNSEIKINQEKLRQLGYRVKA